MQTSDKSRLLPYLENQLDPAERTELADRIAADSALAAEVKRLRRTVESLRQAAARAPSAQAADHWPALRARLVLAPTPHRAPVWVWGASGTALAAVAAAAFAVLWLHPHRAHQTTWVGPRPSPAQTASVPVPAVTPPPVAADAETAVSTRKVAAVPQLPMHTRYDPLAAPHELPYLQANPFASPLPALSLKSRPFLRARRGRPADRQRPTAPLLSAGKMLGHPKAAARPALLPSQTDTPPVVPEPVTPNVTAAGSDPVPNPPAAPVQKTTAPASGKADNTRMDAVKP